MGKITGSGCVAGSCIASYCAAAATVAGNNATEDQGKMVVGDVFLAAIGTCAVGESIMLTDGYYLQEGQSTNSIALGR